MLDSTIGAGKSSVKKVEQADIERFISSQPEIVGRVAITPLNNNADVGASNGIMLFTATYDVGQGPLSNTLVLRHAPGSETRLFHEYDLPRQFRVQRALQGTGVPVPDVLWLDATGEFLGVPGYVMHAVSGEAPNPSAFTKGPLARATPADRELMLDAIFDALVKVHRVDVVAHGLQDFVMNAPGDSPIRKCVNWYWKTWEWINLPEFARLKPIHHWLINQAPAGGTVLMHGDCTLHNYLFTGNQLTGVLDWEMSSLGRAEADLALQCVANELFAAPPGSGLTMPPSQQQWIERYQKAGGEAPEHFIYFRKYAVYMILVALLALQRNLPAEVRAGQAGFRNHLWDMLES